jgi:hypothetical protein
MLILANNKLKFEYNDRLKNKNALSNWVLERIDASNRYCIEGVNVILVSHLI